MKNVFFAHSVNVIGGAERVTLSVMEGVKTHYRCIMLAPDGGELGLKAQQSGAVFEPVSCGQAEILHPVRTLRQFAQYARLIRKYSPEIVHTGDLLAFRSLQPICKLLKIPMVCHVHFPYDKGFMKWAFDRTSPVASFIYCSEELKSNLSPFLSQLVPAARHTVIHNGINTEDFSPGKPRSEDQPLNVGIIGNLQKRKGHEDFLNMARIIVQKGLQVRFHIIGGDILEQPREPLLKAMAIKLNIDQYVVFHGQVSDVRSLLADQDIIVCASHEEAFPITILEAMACAKAIVTTNVNGIPEALNKHTGILVPPHSPAELAEGVITLIEQPALRANIAQNARERVVENFDQSLFIKQILNLYESTLVPAGICHDA
ncbi:glycosyltransferase family 1 protein [Alteromonas aestuariivivens]|uniref:Glycosyltransferase family 1 protein n=1 Tax=Alteromonas aestuariivivens TaxID=1938339 RepID=A0A3D8MFB4_9ALTE|nr:glycosyltransferase [Alteromonas aestuariivivens]RDV29194.1 glycosyltransferase family 1 protein [Alteromonas aestuariivivens]